MKGSFQSSFSPQPLLQCWMDLQNWKSQIHFLQQIQRGWMLCVSTYPDLERWLYDDVPKLKKLNIPCSWIKFLLILNIETHWSLIWFFSASHTLTLWGVLSTFWQAIMWSYDCGCQTLTGNNKASIATCCMKLEVSYLAHKICYNLYKHQHSWDVRATRWSCDKVFFS